MRVDVRDSHLLQPQANVNSLMQAKKIGSPAPLIERSEDFRREVSLL
jgi:hypothetical protein